jgi:hypothetical protein
MMAQVCRVWLMGSSVELKQSIEPLVNSLVILTIFPFPVRTFPSPSLTWFNRPSAVDRPPRDDWYRTSMPQSFIHARNTQGFVHVRKYAQLVQPCID